MDNSKSMTDRNAVQPALNSLAMIWNALQQLEVGQVGVFGFDMEPKLLHSLDSPLTESAGAALLQSLSFDRKPIQEAGETYASNSSDFALLLDQALGYLDDCKASSSRSGSNLELQQASDAAVRMSSDDDAHVDLWADGDFLISCCSSANIVSLFIFHFDTCDVVHLLFLLILLIQLPFIISDGRCRHDQKKRVRCPKPNHEQFYRLHSIKILRKQSDKVQIFVRSAL